MQFYSRVSNLCIICLLVFNIHFSVSAQEGNGYFDSLQERLIEDGFDEKWIKKIYKRRGVTFEAKTISRYFVHSEATLDYNQFSTDDSIVSIWKNTRMNLKAPKKNMVWTRS